MAMDPVSFWMQASVFWLKLFKQQQDAYLNMLGSVAEKVPHEDAATLAAEAEAMRTRAKQVAQKRQPSNQAQPKKLQPT